MAWWDDLNTLIDELGTNVATSPVGQATFGVGNAVTGAVGQAAGNFFTTGLGQQAGGILSSPPAQAFGTFMSVPSDVTKFGTGALLEGVNKLPLLIPGGSQSFDPAMDLAFQQGGPRAAFEQRRSVEPRWFQAPTEALLDPTTYLGFGAGRHVATVAEASAQLAREAGRPVVARGLEAGATMARGSQFLWNDAGQMALERGVQPAFRGVGKIITKVKPSALQTAPSFLERQQDDAITHWINAEAAAPGMDRTPIPSIGDTPAPPQPIHPHPPGSAPAAAYQAGIRGWLRLHSPQLGIIPGMQGADYWRDPSQVWLQPRHIQDMAEIGVAAMQSVTDEGGLFPSLMRASEGSQRMRRGITAKFGPGIEPYIPLAEDRMRSLMVEQGLDPDKLMPASRQFLPHGWSKGVMSARRLEAINKQVQQGAITREEALGQVAKYPKSPQVVEAAAAHGASLLSLYRQGPEESYKAFLPGGAYFPEGIEGSRTNARAVIPKAFAEDVWGGGGPLAIDLSDAGDVLGVAQPFGSNREAWNTYMGKQFPGITPDELDTLAGMSTDMLYHAYVNAASPISGGVRGAEKVFRAVTEGPGVFATKGGKLPDTARKISREKQGEIGGIIPNLTELVDIYHTGMGMRSGSGIAKDYFPRAANEIARIVGRGNYEDAQVLIHALALTSTASDVSRNADLALRVLAEWKFGSDDTLRSHFGIDGHQFDAAMKGGMLRADLRPQQQRSLASAFTKFAQLREGQQPITSSVHGGPKTHSYAGSFLASTWRNSIDTALGGTEVGRRARKAFDAALSVFAWDRHHNRIDQGATGVNAIEAFLNRERGIIAARSAGLSPEEAQSAGWYWARNNQGLLREVGADGDTAQALRNAIEKTWNKDADAKESWDALISRVGQEQNLTPEKAVDETYDLVRQDIFYRLLKRSLDKPEVQAALADAGISPTLQGLKDDALGLISRGSSGLAPDEWPQPLMNATAPGGVVERVMQSTPGQVLRFTGQEWQPHTGGFAVPIATGKAFAIGQEQSFRKSIEGLLNRGVVSDLFDAASGVDNSSRLGLGVVQDGNELRPALFALTDDEARAAAGAARTDTRRVINLDTGTTNPIPGTTRNRHLPGLLEDISGPGTPVARSGVEATRRRGVTMAEMDTVNPVSILQRKVVNPLMDAYASLSLKDGTEQVTGKDLGSITDPAFPEKAVKASPTSWDWRISSNDNAVANQTLKDGRTYRDFFNRARMDARTDMATVQQSGVTWKPYSTLEERLAMADGNPKLQKIIRDWHKQGIDILYAGTPENAAKGALLAQRAEDAGTKLTRQSNASLFKAAWGEMALFSPKFLTGNLQGNWVQNALAGTFMAPSWKEYAAAYKLSEGGLEETTRAQAMQSLKATQIANRYGIKEPPAEILRGGIRGMTSNTARVSPSATGELVGRLTRNKELGRRVGTPFIINNNTAQAIDTVGRASIWGDTLQREMEKAIPDFESEVRRVGQNIPGFEFSIQDGINVPPGGLFAEPLKAQFLDLGIPEGQAEHLVRKYINLQSKGEAAALKEMQRVQFSYDRTNLDEWISKAVPFHYWFSRALRYYGEEAIRHPFLALNYMRAQDGIEDAQSDPGLSARQKGFLRLMGTPLGFSLLMNPDALFGVTKVFNLDSSYEPDGETSLGGAVNWMKDRGFGLYPWIDGTLNLMGLYGNTFEPDLLGIRHKALVGAAVNFLRAHAGLDPASAPYADAMGQVRYAVSSFVSSFTPDWVSQPVPPRTGGSSQEASLDTIIEAQVMANNPGLTNGELLAIMTDPDTPQYKQAYQQAADAGIVQQLLNFSIPENFRMRSDKKDQLAAEIGTTYEAAQAQGVSPYDFAPTQGDLAFRAKYKAMTGKEWQPGDYQDAKTKYDLIRAPLEAKPFIVDNEAYQNLGTPKQQRKFDTYWALRNGTDPRTTGLPDGARKEVALQWADAHHAQGAISDTYALRDAFEASHPEFQEFKQWQDRVSALANLYGGNLAEYRRRASQQNPNAARYFADSETFVKQTFPQEQWAAELDRATTSAAAFNAITGKGTNRQNPGPFPGVPPVDLTLPSMEPPAPPPSNGPYAQDWVKALNAIQPVAPVRFGV